jgi:hypothetical protein
MPAASNMLDMQVCMLAIKAMMVSHMHFHSAQVQVPHQV